jgi:hypothetical protein
MVASSKLILALQVAGFAAAVACFIAIRRSAVWFAFLASFGVHFAGDVLFLLKEGLPMPFSLSNLDKFVKLPAFLVFFGIALAAVCLYLVDAHGFGGHLAKGVAVLGLFIALAGFVYDKIYP